MDKKKKKDAQNSTTKQKPANLLITVPEDKVITNKNYPPVIARSDPVNDLQPFIDHLCLYRPSLTRNIYTDEFPRGTKEDPATKAQEDEFLLSYFTEKDLHVYGGSFLKTALFYIARYNDNSVIEFVTQWTNKFVENPATLHHVERICGNGDLQQFFTAEDLMGHPSTFLNRAMITIKRYVSTYMAERTSVNPAHSQGSDNRQSREPATAEKHTVAVNEVIGIEPLKSSAIAVVASSQHASGDDSEKTKTQPEQSLLVGSGGVDDGAGSQLECPPSAHPVAHDPTTSSAAVALSRPELTTSAVQEIRREPPKNVNNPQRQYTDKKSAPEHKRQHHASFAVPQHHTPLHSGPAFPENYPVAQMAHPAVVPGPYSPFIVQSGPLPSHVPLSVSQMDARVPAQFFTDASSSFPSPALTPNVGTVFPSGRDTSARMAGPNVGTSDFSYRGYDPRRGSFSGNDGFSPLGPIYRPQRNSPKLDPNSFSRFSNDRASHQHNQSRHRRLSSQFSNDHRRMSTQSSDERFLTGNVPTETYTRRILSDQTRFRQPSSFDMDSGMTQINAVHRNPHRGSFSSQRPAYSHHEHRDTGPSRSVRFDCRPEEIIIAPGRKDITQLVMSRVPAIIDSEHMYAFLRTHAHVTKVQPTPFATTAYEPPPYITMFV